MEPRQRPLLALGIRFIAAGLLATMLLLVKLASEHGVSLVETVFWRQSVPAVAILIWLGMRGELARLRTPRFPAHVRRAATGLLGMFLNLGAVVLLPLTEATVLGFTAPIFAVILAAVLLHEKVGPIRWFAVTFGLAGVVLMAGASGGSSIPPSGLAVGISAAFMLALISILLRDLTRTEEPIAVVFWFSALCAPVVAVPALIWGTAHDATTWALLAGLSLVGGLCQLLLTLSLRLGNVSSVIVMDYTAFGWSVLWGWLFFNHLPPAGTWIGAPVIVAAGLLILWREHRLHLSSSARAIAE